MRRFDEYLDVLLEGMDGVFLYKGVTDEAGLKKWPELRVGRSGVVIPGFLSNLQIAFVYSEPDLTGSDSGLMAEFRLEKGVIEDRTDEFMRWCDDNGMLEYDVSLGFPEEWRDDGSVWTVSSSGSGHSGVSCYGDASFVFCGVPVDYTVVEFFGGQDEWLEARGRYINNG